MTRIKSVRGIALITAVIFFMLLSLIVVEMLKRSILSNKENTYAKNKYLSLISAENNFITFEHNLLSDRFPNEAELIYEECGVDYYRIKGKTEVTENMEAKSAIIGSFAVVGDVSKCEPKPTIISGMKSWREVY
jgi:hypothetical protein